MAKAFVDAISEGLTSNAKGRHAELLAQTAFLVNGYEVSEPITPLPYDMIVRNPNTCEVTTVQVKTCFMRDEERYGGQYLVVKGARNNGKTYGKDEVDVFIAVWEGECYLFPNREIKEYWVRPEHIDEKWTKLSTEI